VGGTFTDAVLVSRGEVHTAKVPTTPGREYEGVIASVEQVLERAAVAPSDVGAFIHGMTTGTNALLEERGARTVLMTTRGFTDVIEIGRQARPELYRPQVAPAAPLVPPHLRVEVGERIGPEGVIEPLTDDECAELMVEVAALEPEAVAICLLHSYRDPTHEQILAAAIRRALPDVPVVASHEALRQFREFERTSTTVIDAYLAPLLDRYLGTLSTACTEREIPRPEVMLSAGGTAAVEEVAGHGAWSVLSGPAGGAVGAAALAQRAGEPLALAFDMGGTSCDVSVADHGEVKLAEAREIAGRPLQMATVDVHTVGAGGGSIAWRDAGGALRVGPRSAGAEPGPACYGRGGTEPTVTDANLLLGYLPAGETLAGGIELDRTAAEKAIGGLAGSLGLDPVETAEGIVRVANQEMAAALRVVSVERGIDPRERALVAFGGAGPLHAAAMADDLEMPRIVVPRAGGVLSALGLVSAGRRRDRARTVLIGGDALTRERVESEIAQVQAEALKGLATESAEARAELGLRYRGQSFELRVTAPSPCSPEFLREAFEQEHERRYGYRDPELAIELVTIAVAAVAAAPELGLEARGHGANELVESERVATFGGEALPARVLRGEPDAGTRAEGPCIFELPETTLVLPPGWSAVVDADGTIICERRAV